MLEKVWLLLAKLVQQRAQSSRKTVLLVVVLEEEIAYREITDISSEIFVYQRLRKNGFAATRIRRNPE